MLEFLAALLQDALIDARFDWNNADRNYRYPAPGDDMDDVRWAYEARWRAEQRLRSLGFHGFDVA